MKYGSSWPGETGGGILYAPVEDAMTPQSGFLWVTRCITDLNSLVRFFNIPRVFSAVVCLV